MNARISDREASVPDVMDARQALREAGAVTSPILVTGGTGTLGRLVVAAAGPGARRPVLSRHGHEGGEGIEFVTGDLAKGDGIEAAAEGAEIIVHCAGSSKGDDDKARHLVRAASHAGARHLVYISVVGADRVPMAGSIDRAMFGYFGAKFRAEQIVADSGLPWTTLRATQFHQLTLKTVTQMAKLPVIPVPSGFRFQPVDADEVGAPRRARPGTPAGLVPDVGGPRVRDGRPGAQVPAGQRQAPADPSGPNPGQGRPRAREGRT